MKIEIKERKPTIPPVEIHIILNREEARILGSVCGKIGGNPSNNIRSVTNEIYTQIKNKLFKGNYQALINNNIIHGMETIE